MQRSEFKMRVRDRVKKEQIVSEAESQISPEIVKDALTLIWMSFKHNPANMLTYLEKETIEQFVCAMWGMIWDEDVDISLNSMRILLLLDEKYDIQKYESMNYKQSVQPTIKLLVEELRRVEAHLVADQNDGEKQFFIHNFTEVCLQLLTRMNVELIIWDLVEYHMQVKNVKSSNNIISMIIRISEL